MDTVANLRAFLAVARYGGFSEAARQLNVVPSVAAKRVTQLEHVIGTRLFERSTRKVVLTESGEQFQGRARSLIADLDETLAGLKRAGDRLEGRILMMVPTTLNILVLADALGGFLQQHEHINVELALVDRSVNPAEEGFDLAISGHAASSYEGVINVPCMPSSRCCARPRSTWRDAERRSSRTTSPTTTGCSSNPWGRRGASRVNRASSVSRCGRGSSPMTM